jgi:hypothetical protein
MSADLGSILFTCIPLASLAIPVVVGLYLYDAKKILNEKQRELMKLESELKEGKPTQGVENGNDKGADKKLDATRKELEEKAKELETLKKELEQREDALSLRERAVSQRETKLEEAAVPDVVPAEEEVEEESEAAEADVPAAEEKPKVSEGEKRKKMIEEELAKIVKDAEDNELEEELEPEALEVLQKAAHIICYVKKYYDVINDKVIFFPSVTKCFMNYSLIEEAEKYYYDEDDEFPCLYSGALRQTATESMCAEDVDQDDDYMFKLAMDVEI